MSESIFSKKTLTNLDIAVLVKELSTSLEKSRIINIYAVKGAENSQYVLKVRSREENVFLYIEPEKRVNITKYLLELSNKGNVVLMRRFLRNAVITSITQLGFERIIVIEVRIGPDIRKLIIELIPRGILCITDRDDKILFINKPLKTKDRELTIGSKYVPPPMFPNILNMDIDEALKKLRDNPNKSIGSALVKVLGIPPEVVNEVLSDDLRKLKINEVHDNDLKEAVNKVLDFIRSVISDPSPTLILIKDSSEYVSFHPFSPKNLWSNSKYIAKPFGSFNELVDEYFRALTSKRIVGTSEKEIKGQIDRISKILDNIEREREEALNKLQELSKVIEVIEKHYIEVENALNCAVRIVKTCGWVGDKLRECLVKNYDPHSGRVTLIIEGQPIELYVNKPLSSQYFELIKERKNLEKKIEKINSKREELLKELEQKRTELSLSASIKPLLLRVDWFSKFHWIITSNGFLAIGGRNAEQNEKIVRRYLSDNDIFVHADIHGGAAFVMITKGRKPTEDDLLEVASLAASYSKAWKLGLRAVDVYWVLGSQVSKSAPPGEYLGKGAFMIRGKKNYIKSVNLELAIGLEVLENKYYRIIVGPEKLLSKRAVGYVVITPGDDDGSKIAKEISKYFKENDKRVSKIPLNIIEERIPGKSKIVRKVWLRNNQS